MQEPVVQKLRESKCSCSGRYRRRSRCSILLLLLLLLLLLGAVRGPVSAQSRGAGRSDRVGPDPKLSWPWPKNPAPKLSTETDLENPETHSFHSLLPLPPPPPPLPLLLILIYSTCSHSAVPKEQLQKQQQHDTSFCCKRQQSGSPKVVRSLKSNRTIGTVRPFGHWKASAALNALNKETKTANKQTKQLCVVCQSSSHYSEGGGGDENTADSDFCTQSKSVWFPAKRPSAGCPLGNTLIEQLK